MKKYCLLILLLVNVVAAQNKTHTVVVDRFVSDFNNSEYENIYRSFSVKMQNSRPKKYFFDIFSIVKNRDGKILSLDLLDYRENSKETTHAKYNAGCETGNIDLKITIDKQGQIVGLFLKKAIYM